MLEVTVFLFFERTPEIYVIHSEKSAQQRIPPIQYHILIHCFLSSFAARENAFFESVYHRSKTFLQSEP